MSVEESKKELVKNVEVMVGKKRGGSGNKRKQNKGEAGLEGSFAHTCVSSNQLNSSDYQKSVYKLR